MAARLGVNEATEKFPCPACGYLTSSFPGSFDLCPICWWEDDPVQLQCPDQRGGANGPSLIESQRHFAECSASDPALRDKVQPPGPADRRDPKWRPWDAAKDTAAASDIKSGKDYFDAVGPADGALARDPATFYYWLR
jgi:hypothetical protein